MRSRLDQIAAVGAALDTHDRAVDRREQAEQELDVATTALGAATERLGTAVGPARRGHNAGRTRRRWAGGCQQLRFPDPQALTERVESETAVLAAVDAVATAALQEITRRETAPAALDIARTERRELAEQERELAAERDLPPAAPPTRTTDRSAMAGAPLWQLVEFTDAVPDAARPGSRPRCRLPGCWTPGSGPAARSMATTSSPTAPLTGSPVVLADVLVAAPVEATAIGLGSRGRAAAARRSCVRRPLPAGPRPRSGPTAAGGWAPSLGPGRRPSRAHRGLGPPARQGARRRAVLARIGELDATIAALDGELSRWPRDGTWSPRNAPPGPRTTNWTPRSARCQSRVDRDAADGAAAAAETVTQREREVGRRSACSRPWPPSTARRPSERRCGCRRRRTCLRRTGAAWLEDEEPALRATAPAPGRAAARSAATPSSAGRPRRRRGHAGLAARLAAIEGAIGVDYREVLAEMDARQAQAAPRGPATGQNTALAGRLGGLSPGGDDAKERDAAAGRRDTAARGSGSRHRRAPRRHRAADLAASTPARRVRRRPRRPGSRPSRRRALGGGAVRAEQRRRRAAPALRGGAYRADHAQRTADLELETTRTSRSSPRSSTAYGSARPSCGRPRAEGEPPQRDHRQGARPVRPDADRRHPPAPRCPDPAGERIVDGMNARLERVRTASRVAVRLVWEVSPELPPGTRPRGTCC